MKTRVLFVALAIVSAGTLCAQNKVNGCVIDRTDNSKLIGVNVTLSNDSGQVAGTTTDNNGKFTLNAEKGDYILELSYIGYETIRMALTVKPLFRKWTDKFCCRRKNRCRLPQMAFLCYRTCKFRVS